MHAASTIPPIKLAEKPHDKIDVRHRRLATAERPSYRSSPTFSLSQVDKTRQFEEFRCPVPYRQLRHLFMRTVELMELAFTDWAGCSGKQQ